MSSQSPSLQSYPSCQSLPLSPLRYTLGHTTSKALTARQQLKLQRCNKYLPLPKLLCKPELIAPPQEVGLCGGAASAHPLSLQTIPPSTTAATTQRHPAPGPDCLGPCCQEGLAQGSKSASHLFILGPCGGYCSLSQLQSDPGGANECLPCLAN